MRRYRDTAGPPYRRSPRVAIVGAGFGGLGVALRLQARGLSDFVIFDDRAAVGGTWCANTYPGAACDAPSHVYSYSFRPAPWSRRFAPGPEIQEYLAHCVADGGLAARLRLGTRVTAARWTGADWIVEFDAGAPERFDVVVLATGQLNVPARPAIPGLDTFAGRVVHTAAWPSGLDLSDKRVAVVGTGASAAQIVPELAATAAHLTVFQRSAPYVFPKLDSAYSARLRRRWRRAPASAKPARLGLALLLEFSNLAFWKWPKAMWLLERWHALRLRRIIADPRLRAALTPDYRAGCKRILMSSTYHPAFARPNVTLDTAPIQAVDARGPVTATGRHAVDTIVLATGFDTSAFASTVTVVGPDGLDLSTRWESDGPSAYFGMSAPGFPNVFLVYGPNTNLGSGSIIFMLETQANHIADAVALLAWAPAPSRVEVRQNAFRRYDDRLRRQLARPSVWNAGCHSWYQDAAGRNTHNWPTSVLEYRLRARRLRERDYLLTALRPPAPDHPPISPNLGSHHDRN